MTPTLKTIAEKHGLSVATVSRVLNGLASRYRISKKTEELVLKTARELDYNPNPQARSLRTRHTNTIGLLIPDISNPFFATIVQNIEREARKSDYSIILCDSEDETHLEKQLLKMLKARKVDGLIVFPVGQDSSHLKELYEKGMPIVLVDRCFPDIHLPFVASDNYQGAFEAVSYLIENGHSTIACIQGLPKTFPNDQRVQGYLDAHKKYNISVNKSLIVGESFGMQNGYIETKMLLNLDKRPTAILALSNLIAVGSLKAIADEKLSVPQDISLISFDDQPYLAILSTPLTTVKQQSEEMGKIAVKILLNQINNAENTNSAQILLPTKLIKRKSVSRRNKKVGLGDMN